MSGHGLCRADNGFVSVVAQSRLDGMGFVDITQRRRGAVSVQVVDLVGTDTRIAHGIEHGAAWSVHAGRGHVTSVGAHAVPPQLGVNFRASGFGMFVLFEHHHTSAFAQHKTVAVLVPGARSSCRVVVAG